MGDSDWFVIRLGWGLGTGEEVGFFQVYGRW